MDGDPRLPRPDGHAQPDLPAGQPAGPEALALVEGDVRFPVLHSLRNSIDGVFMPTSVHDVAVMIYGNPSDIEIDTVVDLAVVGAGPAGLAAAVYAASDRGPPGARLFASPGGKIEIHRR